MPSLFGLVPGVSSVNEFNRKLTLLMVLPKDQCHRQTNDRFYLEKSPALSKEPEPSDKVTLSGFPSVNKAAKLLKLGSVSWVTVNVRPTSAEVMLVPPNKGAFVAGLMH
jgi:hypothetical protein